MIDNKDKEFKEIHNNIKEKIKTEYIIHFVGWLIAGIIVTYLDIKFIDKYIHNLFGVSKPSNVSLSVGF